MKRVAIVVVIIALTCAAAWQQVDNQRLHGELDKGATALAEAQRLEANVSSRLRTCSVSAAQAELRADAAEAQAERLQRDLAEWQSTSNTLEMQQDATRRQLNLCQATRDSLEEQLIIAKQQLTAWQALADDRLDKINDCISTANSGVLLIRDIPAPGFISSLGDPAERLRRKYNDLVDRFNAAVERSNDIADLLRRALGRLQ